MKDSTKRVLLGIGGATVGAVAAAAGGGMIGLSIAGILWRTGAAKPPANITQEGVRILSSTGTIVGGFVRGLACSIAGVKLGADSGAIFGEALQDKQIEKKAKVSITREEDAILVEAQ